MGRTEHKLPVDGILSNFATFSIMILSAPIALGGDIVIKRLSEVYKSVRKNDHACILCVSSLKIVKNINVVIIEVTMAKLYKKL